MSDVGGAGAAASVCAAGTGAGAAAAGSCARAEVTRAGLALATTPPPTPKAGEGGPPSAQQGAALFRNPSLGSNGKSCTTCHEGGTRLDPEELAEASDGKLAAYANSCIEAMLSGPRLPEGSPRLGSLVLHLRTFQQKAR